MLGDALQAAVRDGSTRWKLNSAKTFLAILIVAAVGTAAHAATYVVTSTNDAGPGSLRQAVLDANAAPGADVITFSNVPGPIVLLSPLELSSEVAIQGQGARTTTVQAATPLKGASITVGSAAIVTISGLTLAGVSALWSDYDDDVCTLANAGTLCLRDCEVRSAYADAARGAAIRTSGILTISGSTFAGNVAGAWGETRYYWMCFSGAGGALYIASGSVGITNTTFSGNGAASFVYPPSLSCLGVGGAIFIGSGDLFLVNCTMTGNYAAEGGGICNAGGRVTLRNTIVTDSVFGTVDVTQNNLITDATAAKLCPLQDNGGPTRTCALLPDSPAIDQGTSVGAPLTDQRGVARPQGRHVDIGAFELEGVPILFRLDTISNGAGTVARNPNLTAFPPNTVVSLAAMADEDYAFDHWSGDATGQDSPLVLTIDRDWSIVANFRPAPATVIQPPGWTNLVINTNSWGPGSFRQAMRDLVASGGGAIRFSNVTGVISLPLGVPRLTVDADIRGPGREVLTLRSGVLRSLFDVAPRVTVRVSGLAAENGYATNGAGGAILNAGTLTLSRVRLSSCYATTNGGAIFNAGSLQVSDCVFAQNGAPSGGTLYNEGDLRVIGSAFLANGSGGDFACGGAFYNKTGQAQFAQCAFSHNRLVGRLGGSSPIELNGGSGWGGALYLEGGNVGLVDTLISDNSIVAGAGGFYPINLAGSGGSAFGSGIYVSDGALTLTNCALCNNQAVAGDAAPALGHAETYGGRAEGGGMFVDGGTVVAVNCTLSGNEVRSGAAGGDIGHMYPRGEPGRGGGLRSWLGERTAVSLINCTISGNRAFGGMWQGYTAFAGRGESGGIYADTNLPSGTLTLINTIVGGNFGATAGTNGIIPSDGFGPLHSLGHNLVGAVSDTTGFLSTDLLNTDPRLGPLQDNGGPTPTHALLAGSPAIDAGAPIGVPFDQRGRPRTIDDPAVPNAPASDGTDIGALEVDPVLRMTGVSSLDTNVLVRFTTVSDHTYGLEQRPDISGSPWAGLPEVVPGTGGIVTFTNYGAGPLPSRFYHAFQRRP